jgi:hypothetical protein
VYTVKKGWNLDLKNTEERHVPGNYVGKWEKQNVLCDLNASFLRGRPGKLDGWYFGVGVAGATAALCSNELAKVTVTKPRASDYNIHAAVAASLDSASTLVPTPPHGRRAPGGRWRPAGGSSAGSSGSAGMSGLGAPIETASPAPSSTSSTSTSSTSAPSLAAASSAPATKKRRSSASAATTPTPKRRLRSN